jgi:hypothetical protein
MHGSGTFYFPDNKVYTGDFKSGAIDGIGTMKYPDRRKY